MRKKFQLAEEEAKFADLIWEREPLRSGELVKLASEKMNWKKSTTYTVLKKLCERGVFQNKGAVVTAKMSREEFYGRQGRQLVKEAFGGSLPGFLTAFIGGRGLSEKEVEELQSFIDRYKDSGERREQGITGDDYE